MRALALLAALLPVAWAAKAYPTQSLVSSSRAWSGYVRLQNVGTGDSLAGDGLSLAPMDVDKGDIVHMTARNGHVTLEVRRRRSCRAEERRRLTTSALARNGTRSSTPTGLPSCTSALSSAHLTKQLLVRPFDEGFDRRCVLACCCAR